MGGVEKNLLLLSEVLIKNRHEVFVGARDGVVRPLLEKNGVCFKRYRFNLRNICSIWKDSFQLLKQIGTDRPDIIHSFSAAPSVVLFVSKVIYYFKTPFYSKKLFPVTVSSIMGLQNSENEHVVITQVRNYLTIMGTKRTFVISPKIDSYVRRLPINKKRLKNCGVVGVKKPKINIGEFNRSAIRKQVGIPEKNRIVITIGHLHPRKSHDLFVKMAEIVLKNRNDITFLIVGDGPLMGKLEKQIENTGYTSNIKLLGLRNDIYELLSIADICVKPGVVEGFIGITVLEAQITGIPVIAFDTIDVRMAIKNRETGIICRSGDVDEMAKDICILLDDRELAKKIAEKGRKLATQTFAIDAIVENLVQAYTLEYS